MLSQLAGLYRVSSTTYCAWKPVPLERYVGVRFLGDGKTISVAWKI